MPGLTSCFAKPGLATRLAVLPELARFRDINEPLSLTLVSPNDLAAGFGPGVELKRVIFNPMIPCAAA